MYDLIVIGGGPAGCAAALRAAQMGGQVLLVEKDKLGGACLHWGCIPSKVLFHHSEILESYRDALDNNLIEGSITFNVDRANKRQKEVVEQLYLGLQDLFSKSNIEIVVGRALVRGAGSVLVTNEVEQEFVGRNILIAGGLQKSSFSYSGATGVQEVEQSLQLPSKPCRVAVIGGGNTGLELASAYSSFDFNVTVVEKEKLLIPALRDEELSKWLAFFLKRRGLKLFTGSTVENIKQIDGPNNPIMQIVISRSGKEEVINADLIINASGRKPCLDFLAPECAIVKSTTNCLSVNEYMETSVKGIYAAGDITGPPMLASLAYFEGITAAMNAMGVKKKLNKDAVPSIVAARPAVAWVGLTEKEATEKGIKPQKDSFPFASCGAAVIRGEEEGFVKLIAGEDGIVIGMQVLGASAEELIMEGTLAIRHGLNIQELSETIHPHPTQHEAVWETSLLMNGYPMYG